jgi:hypothetical protein
MTKLFECELINKIDHILKDVKSLTEKVKYLEDWKVKAKASINLNSKLVKKN